MTTLHTDPILRALSDPELGRHDIDLRAVEAQALRTIARSQRGRKWRIGLLSLALAGAAAAKVLFAPPDEGRPAPMPPALVVPDAPHPDGHTLGTAPPVPEVIPPQVVPPARRPGPSPQPSPGTPDRAAPSTPSPDDIAEEVASAPTAAREAPSEERIYSEAHARLFEDPATAIRLYRLQLRSYPPGEGERWVLAERELLDALVRLGRWEEATRQAERALATTDEDSQVWEAINRQARLAERCFEAESAGDVRRECAREHAP